MLCFIISNPISLTIHKKLLLQVICQSSLLFPSLYCMTQLNYDVYWYFNVIFITVHMPKGFSRSYIFISWKKYIFKTSVFEKQENSFSSFLLLQDKTKVKVFPRLLYEALDQFEKKNIPLDLWWRTSIKPVHKKSIMMLKLKHQNIVQAQVI